MNTLVHESLDWVSMSIMCIIHVHVCRAGNVDSQYYFSLLLNLCNFWWLLNTFVSTYIHVYIYMCVYEDQLLLKRKGVYSMHKYILLFLVMTNI